MDLEYLRQRLARIDAKYAAGPKPPAMRDGCEVENEAGRFWMLDKRWPPHHRHGAADVGALAELPAGLLTTLEPGASSAPERWIFLDTETTGLMGGSGTLAFLIGVGWIGEQGFELRQYFIREHGEEPAALTHLAELLEGYEVIVTYNGKAFDIPLLETRYRMSRLKPPFGRLVHVDLLHSARRLWRLALDSCRLQDLEARIMGVERHGDVDGALIPAIYFEWLRTRDARPLQPVFSHNAIDILSLACLTAIVPQAIDAPETLTRGGEMVGLGRWMKKEGRLEDALTLFRRAVSGNLSEELLYHTLWQIASIEKKLARHDAAVAVWAELTTIENPFRAQAYEQLAIHYERREKNYAMALEMTRAALELGGGDALHQRRVRLEGRINRPKAGRLL